MALVEHTTAMLERGSLRDSYRRMNQVPDLLPFQYSKSLEGLIVISKFFQVSKAPASERIPNHAIEVAIIEAPELFGALMQKCQDEGHFSDTESDRVYYYCRSRSYRRPVGIKTPICLLDTTRKMLERVIINRLQNRTGV